MTMCPNIAHWRAEVTDVRHGLSSFPEGRGHGMGIGWRSGTSSVLQFRKASDILDRVAGGGKRHAEWQRSGSGNCENQGPGSAGRKE